MLMEHKLASVSMMSVAKVMASDIMGKISKLNLERLVCPLGFSLDELGEINCGGCTNLQSKKHFVIQNREIQKKLGYVNYNYVNNLSYVNNVCCPMPLFFNGKTSFVSTTPVMSTMTSLQKVDKTEVRL